MTSDQVLPAAIGVAILILIGVGAVRVMTRRRGGHEGEFGAGGVTQVPIGSIGMATTELAPSGVVQVVGETWTARSNGAAIPAGADIRVVRQDGLTLIVETAPGGMAGSGPAVGP